jgi:putative DNA methylase
MTLREKTTRRHLPHWYVPGAHHFATFRLAGSLPAVAIEQLRDRKKLLLRQKRSAGLTAFNHRQSLHKQLFAKYDGYLDRQSGDCWLEDERIAAVVRGSIYFLHSDRYRLHAYVIMPNHVHILFTPTLPELSEDTSIKADSPSAPPPSDMPDIGEQPDELSPLSSIMHSLKSFTAHRANEILCRSGSFWQHESYDHWVRDQEQLARIVDYIGANPVRAELAVRPHEYFWCSAHDRLLKDGETTPWLPE